MPIVRGFQVQAAMAAETTLGTEVATTRKLRYISDSLDKTFAPIENESLVGSASMGTSDQGIASVGGDLVLDWDYTLIDVLFTKFFGTHTVQAGDDMYTLEDVVDDLGYTLAVGKVVDEWVFKGCKASQLVIAGAPGQPMRCTWSLFPSDRVLSSVLNTQAVLDALGEPTTPRVLFHHCATGVWIGDQVDILTVADTVKVNSWQLTINRQMEQFHANAQAPEQARESGFQTVELQIGMPLYQDNTYVLAHAAHTPMQCRTAFTRSAAVKTIRIPNMYVTACEAAVSGPGLVPHTVTFSCKNDMGGSNASADMDFAEAVRLYEA